MAMRLVLLPGLDGTGELFDGLLRALPEGFAVTVVGYPRDRRLSFGELLPLIEAMLPDEPYVLIAESFSVPLAIRIAASGPEHLKGLVLCAGFATSPVRGLLKNLCRMLAPVALAIPLPRFVAGAFLIGPGAPEGLWEALRDALAAVKTTVLVGRLREVLGCDVMAELVSVVVPMLYVRAGDDRLVGAAAYEGMRLIQPELRLAVVPGPHLILQREPVLCAGVIVGFVEGLGEGVAG